MPRENNFQAGLVKELHRRFPDCMVLKLDSSHIQGIPDLLILWGPRWATLEVKRSPTAKRQMNQEYYVFQMNEMSFSAFICPENCAEVLDELQQALTA